MATKELTTFGKRLERITKEKGLTDSELAKKLKMAQPQLFLLKRSELPREKTLQKLSKALNKPLDFWLAGIPTPASKSKTATSGRTVAKNADRVSGESLLSSARRTLAKELIPTGVFSKHADIDALKVYLVFELNGKEKRILIA